MAQDLGQDFSSGTAPTGLFGSAISAGSSDLSDSIDFGAVAPVRVVYELKIATGTGTPDGNEQAEIKVSYSNDNTDYDDSTNETVVDAINIGTASTTFIKLVTVWCKTRYAKIRVTNDQSAGPSITTSSSIAVVDVFYDQA